MSKKDVTNHKAVNSTKYKTRDWNYDFDSSDVGNSLAANLVEARMAAGLKQKELAKLINYVPGLISSLEKGRCHTRIETLMRIAVALNVTPNDLLKKRGTFESPDFRAKKVSNE